MNKYYYLIYIFAVIILFIFSFYLPPFFVHVPLIVASVLIFKTAFYKLFKEKIIGTEFFLVIATIIALIVHEERAITIVLIIMLIGHFLEEIIEDRTKYAIKNLIKLIPNQVILKQNNIEKIISIKQLKIDDQIIIKDNKRIPADGIVISGMAFVNESALTGESILQEKKINNYVYAGTVIESGSLIIKVTKIGADTIFGKISELILQAESGKARITLLADKIAFWFVPFMLIFICIIWLITKNSQLIITLLVFGTPLELTLVTPLAVLSGVIAAFKNGILIKGPIILERLSSIDTIIFDKTGTLTIGDPEIVKIDILDSKYNIQDIIKLAAIAEKNSGHILAKALLKKAKEENILIPDPDIYISIPGKGVEAIYQNQKYLVGSECFILSKLDIKSNKINSTIINNSNNYSSFYLACNNNICARIYITDLIRQEAKEVIENLKKQNINIILLSGDKKNIVEDIGKKLNIDNIYSEFFPEQKFNKIKELELKNHKVAMIGDGINDAPALKQAYVGIALGAMGIEPAIDAADIVLMTNDLRKINFVYELSKHVMKIIKQNIFIGFLLIHTLGIILAFLNILNPVQAAFFHAIPDISMVLNSARIINFKIK